MNTLRRLVKSHEFWLFAGLLACYAYFPPRWAEWNQNSRMDLTLAIVDQGQFAIDDYYQNTGDYAAYGGHIYTDKAPGASFLAAPSYAVYRSLNQLPFVDSLIARLSSNEALARTLQKDGTGLLAEKIYFAGALYFSTFFTVSIASALASVALYRFLAMFVANRQVRLVVTIGYALGTIVLPYSSVLYGQQLAGAFILFAWERLYRVRRESAPSSALFVAGACLGLAILIEFTSAVPAVILVIYLFSGLARKSQMAKLIAGGLPFALLLGFYNAVSFGSPFASSYRHLVNFSEISNYGLQGFGLPSLEALWGITFSPFRGLFVYSPFLLLALPGWWVMRRNASHRAEWKLTLAAFAAHLLLISSWFDWKGGFAIGPRNLLLVLPFAIVPTAIAVERAWPNRALRGLALGLIIASCLIVGLAAVSGQEFAPIHIPNPLIDFFLPKFQSGDIARNLGMFAGLPAHWSLLPVAALLGGLLVWMYRGKPERSPTRV
jgi:hypothetical protein